MSAGPRECGVQRNNTGEIKPEIEPVSWKFWRKRRYIVVFMAFLGFFNMYSLRVNLSIGIVAMTEIRTVYYPNGTIGHDQEFPWDSKDRGLILSSFFWGYMLTQVFGGFLGSKLGGSFIFGFGIVVTSILTLITPLAAKTGIGALITVRFFEGIFEGITIPSIHTIWSRWAPPHERSRMVTISFAGIFVGTVVSMTVSGILANQFGWESLFYVFGAIGCVWHLFWIIIVRESPDKDRYISEDELRYIQDSLGSNKITNIKHPWKNIFTSKPVYAICIAHFAENWGFYTMLTQLPNFLKGTLGYRLENAGLLAAAPYLAMAISSVIGGYFADTFQVRGYTTTTQVRKYFTCGGFLVQTIFLMTAAYIISPIGTIACIIIAIGLGGVSSCGYVVNHLDIAPQYSGVLLGLSATFGSVPGAIAPTLTGYIAVNSTPDEWRTVFIISSVLYLIGCVFYWMWASGEIQPWAQKELVNENFEKSTTNKAKNVDNDANELR